MEKLDTLTPLGRRILNEIKERPLQLELLTGIVEVEKIPEASDGPGNSGNV